MVELVRAEHDQGGKAAHFQAGCFHIVVNLPGKGRRSSSTLLGSELTVHRGKVILREVLGEILLRRLAGYRQNTADGIRGSNFDYERLCHGHAAGTQNWCVGHFDIRKALDFRETCRLTTRSRQQ
jgi:hypothetical protein